MSRNVKSVRLNIAENVGIKKRAFAMIAEDGMKTSQKIITGKNATSTNKNN
jgi:hypothetical protein